jgi:DNA-binding MarR family transcriptional regulator
MHNQEVFVDLEKNLREICINIKNKGRQMLQHFDLTPPQFEALQHLVREGDQTLGELSLKMYLACSTITDLLDRMEKSELVLRVKDLKDKRITRVKVLPKGFQVIESVLDARRQFLQGALLGVDDEALEAIVESVLKLNAFMSEEQPL